MWNSALHFSFVRSAAELQRGTVWRQAAGILGGPPALQEFRRPDKCVRTHEAYRTSPSLAGPTAASPSGAMPSHAKSLRISCTYSPAIALDRYRRAQEKLAATLRANIQLTIAV